MLLDDSYLLRADRSRTVFRFTSEGPQGQVPKLIVLEPSRVRGVAAGALVFNLALGDDIGNDALNDDIVTNNGDTLRVLLTVAAAVDHFMQVTPGAQILIRSGTPARTRLYRTALARYLHQITPPFQVFGLLGTAWQPFQPDAPYRAFLVTHHPDA